MFSIQKCSGSFEVYINYNEYVKEEDDESVPILENIFSQGEVKKFKGIIDLITVKSLSQEDITKIKEIHDVLRKKEIKDLNIISDNRKLLNQIKNIIPDVSITVFRKE